jgi:hypothetical protein
VKFHYLKISQPLLQLATGYSEHPKGSRNHLRSFVANLVNQGVTYVPQYMGVVDYSAIIATPIER